MVHQRQLNAYNQTQAHLVFWVHKRQKKIEDEKVVLINRLIKGHILHLVKGTKAQSFKAPLTETEKSSLNPSMKRLSTD
jgi:hypothetical protein